MSKKILRLAPTLKNLIGLEQFILSYDFSSSTQKNACLIVATELFENIVLHSKPVSFCNVNVLVDSFFLDCDKTFIKLELSFFSFFARKKLKNMQKSNYQKKNNLNSSTLFLKKTEEKKFCDFRDSTLIKKNNLSDSSGIFSSSLKQVTLPKNIYFNKEKKRYSGLGLIMCKNLTESLEYRCGLIKNSIVAIIGQR